MHGHKSRDDLPAGSRVLCNGVGAVCSRLSHTAYAAAGGWWLVWLPKPGPVVRV